MKIGIDIGGSHIAVALVEKDKIIKKIEEDNIVKTEENIIFTIVNLINRLIKDEKIELIGIAAPGTIKEGTIVKATNLKLKNFDIVSDLKQYYNIPIILRNDAKCAAIAEKYYGSMKSYQDTVFLNIGTGIGGAVFVDNILLTPKRVSGFELGHTTIKENGKLCSCGRKGCFEQYASINHLKKEIQKELKIKKELTGLELYDIILKNKVKLEDVIDKYIDYLKIRFRKYNKYF